MKFLKDVKGSLSKALITLFIVLFTVVVFISGVIFFDSLIHPNEIPSFFGYKAFVVRTNSMEKTFLINDLIIVKEGQIAKVKTGDIISFQTSKKQVIVHRVYSISDLDDRKIATKGDNRDEVDDIVITEENYEGKVVAHIKGLGRVVLFLQSTLGMLICLSIPLIIFIILLLKDNYQYKRMLTKKD